MEKNSSNGQLDNMLKEARQKLGADVNSLKGGGRKDPNELLKKLKPADAAKVKQVMSDPRLTEQILNTPQAKMLLKKLMGDK